MRLLRVFLAAGVLALIAAPVAGAEIVYMKGLFDQTGSTLWAMNDDDSGGHQLLSSSQVSPNDRLGYPSLLPNGTKLAFEGITDEYANLNGPPGDDGATYGGIYTMSNGATTRISDPPQPAANSGSEDTSPSLTADGRVVYESIATTYDSYGYVTGSSSQLLARPLAGGAPSSWSTSPSGSGSGGFSADPANGGLIAYMADSNGSNPRQLQIGDQTAASTTVVATQPEGFDPAWSPDGSQIVDVDWTQASNAGQNGFTAGIWLFPAGARATAHEILVDPTPPTSSLDSGTFSNPVFAGPNEVLFGANSNIYEVPTSCNACTFTSPQVKQLTTDGTSSSPDTNPAWTSQTLTEFGKGSIGGGGSGTAAVGHVHVTGATASVPVTCAGGAGARCSVSLRLSVTEIVKGGRVIAIAAAKKKKTKKIVVVGRSTVTLTAGETKTVHLVLNGTGKRLLAKAHSLKTRLVVAESGKTVSTSTLTFKAKHSKHKR